MRTHKEFECLECNKKFNSCYLQGVKYCSYVCRTIHKYTEKYKDWINNNLDTKVGMNRRIFFTKALIQRDGYSCSNCNLTQWNNLPIPLEIEHKDGNADNNLSDNLCLLCPNCHAQTPTYKGKNLGNGRTVRRRNLKTKV